MKCLAVYISFFAFLFLKINGTSQCTFNGTLTTSSNDSICLGETYNGLYAIGAFDYSWSPSLFLSDTASSNPTIIAPSQTTTYQVIGFDNSGCSDTAQVEIFIHNLPVVNAGEDTLICPGTNLQLNASGGLSFQWLVTDYLSNFLISNPIASPINPTEYIVEATDSNNCSNKDTINVQLHNNAIANAGFNVSICANQPYLLGASGGVSYSWEPSNYVNHPNSPTPLAFPDDDMDFTVEVTDSNGCKDTDTVQILIFSINTDSDTIVCKGDSIQLNIYGDPATEFIWTPYDGVSDSSSYEPWISPLTTTSYVITATDATGCSFTDTILLETPNVEAIIDTIITSGCNGLYIDFINESSQNLSFSWNFSDNTTSNEFLLEKSIEFNSHLDAQLVVGDQLGCSDTANVSISSESLETYFNFNDYNPPNVFTPNGDSINDIFIIEMPGKINECAELVIYNKWGEIQFSSLGNNLYWDGYTNTGILANQGIYYYSLRLNNESKMGHIQLFR